MGKQGVKDNVIDPIKALQAGNLTFAAAQQMYNGVIPIGDDGGVAVAYDINKQVKQPLVLAEQKHILGILDARESGYDLLNIAVPALDPIGTPHIGQLTVPSDELWYVNTIVGYSPASGALSQIGYNWYCSMWTDRLGALGYGQAFYGTEPVSLVNLARTHYDDFHTSGPLFDQWNRDVLLRLPGGTVLTCIFTTRTNATTPAITCNFRVFGHIGKILVA